MKKVLIALLASLATTTAAVAADSYTADPTHTYPSFEISHLGFSTTRGAFHKAAGKVVLDTAARSGRIDITIDTASINTGLGKRDDHLRGPDFFNAEQFPSITFASSKLKFNGDKLVGAEGELTMLGVTRPVSLTVDSFVCGTHPMNKKAVCGANAVTTIKRSEWGMKTYLPAVGDDVKIAIQIEAFKD
jgi:polyisoprenoid-binding protein YceI